MASSAAGVESGAAVVLGIDVGTTSAKAVAFTTDGTVRASGQVGYSLSAPQPGWAEQDPDAVFAAVLEATAQAARTVREAGYSIAGLSFSAAMHGLIGLDAAGAPQTPLVTWADRRAEKQAARLRSDPAGLAMHRRTGTPVHPMSPAVKLRWFTEEQPAVVRRVRHWVGIKEYLLATLAGELVVDHGIASGTGLFNLGNGSWDCEALGYAGVSADQLPRLVPTTDVLRLKNDGASRLGLPAGLPVVVGGGDGPLANLGLGAVRAGSAACSIGTSGAIRVAVDAPRVDGEGRVFCYNLAPGRYVIGGAVNNGGIVLDWLRDAVGTPAGGSDRADRADPAALLDVAASAPAGSDGLLFLPYLLGERAPHWSGGARACYLGLSREHGREHLVRAGLEGVCLQLAVVLDSVRRADADVHEIRATGGFSRSALWRRILVNAFGRPIGFAASAEGSSLGAALLGMTALGLLDGLDRAAELVTLDEVEQPDPREAAVYAQLLPVFEQAYDALRPVFPALQELADALPRLPDDAVVDEQIAGR